MLPKIILHGGFLSEADVSMSMVKAKQQALAGIATNSYHYLTTHTAFDTVIFAVKQLEDCELFNAGTGSQIQRDGKIRMSASVMDGTTMKFSGVINIQNIQNPVCVAERLMRFDDRVLADEGAVKFAISQGFEVFDPETPVRRKEFEAKAAASGVGTVGCVVLDGSGKLASATSTGGKGFEIPGRVSDSATVAGNFANASCGVSCTGIGEDIVSGAIATKIVTRVTDGMALRDACQRTFDELKPFDGFAGAVALSTLGEIVHIESYPTMVFASYDGAVLSVFQQERNV